MKLLHLLYDFCNLYGDYGNILTLARALGESANIRRMPLTELSGELDFTQYGFIYIGSATEKNQRTALEFLRVYRDALKAALDNGTVILATGNSFEMFGKELTEASGETVKGLGLFDFTVTRSDERTVTDIHAVFSGTKAPITGFINRCSAIHGVDSPFFEIIDGIGNTPDDKREGIISGGFYGTHIIGPLLVRNPELAQYFAELLR